MALTWREMELIKQVERYTGASVEKFYKRTLFRSDTMLLGLNCLEPGQVQKPHEHANRDKFYYVVEGSGRFWLSDQHIEATVGGVVWAPAGVVHGVANESDSRLTLFVGIAPAP